MDRESFFPYRFTNFLKAKTSCSLERAIFAVHRNHISTVGVHRNRSLPFSFVGKPILRHCAALEMCQASAIQESIQRSGQTVFIFHLLLFWTKVQWDVCSLQLLCPGSSSPIQTASDYLMVPRSKPQSESEHCGSVKRLFPNFVPFINELQSPFHSSKLQPSFHSSQFQPSFQEVSVVRRACF